MNLPFTTLQFLDIFESYNISVFPAQVVFLVLAMIAVLLAFLKARSGGIYITAILALFWVWMGTVYHIMFFSAINKPAYVFGAVFILQGILFVYEGLIRRNLSFAIGRDFRSVTGLVLIIYALVVYPLLGYYGGHVYPKAPSFGVPCPTTIFTFGILLFSTAKLRLYLLIIPFVWSLIGLSAAFLLGIKEDIGLPAAGILAVLMASIRNKQLSST